MSNNENLKPDIILVGFIPNGEKSILTVGKPQPGGTSEVINAFGGPEAIELYQKLITRNEAVFGKEEEKNDVQGTTED
jgi:hypothetical protein